MLPSLPDIAGGWIPENLVHGSLADLLPANVTHIQAAATAIDLDARTVQAGERRVPYDYLLIAAGSVPNFFESPFPRDR